MLLAVLAATGIVGAIEDISPHPFYDPPPLAAAGKPGEILRSEPLAGAPAGSVAFKVLYRSTDLKGAPIAVSGVVVVPQTPPPPGGRPVVAWAHPTTGIARKCAPSFLPTVFANIPGLADMLARGFVVAATDYQGLGTPGPHPYLIGVPEARSVLDSVRAARALPGSAAGSRYAVWGHSQGGQASVFSDIIAKDYAPELTLVGAAAAAPASELSSLLNDDAAKISGKVFTAYSLWAWSAVYGVNGGEITEPAAFPVVEEIAGHCIESVGEDYATIQIESQLKGGVLTVDLDKTPPWSGFIQANTPNPQAIRAPLFIAQGLKDPIVEPNVTIAFVNSVCRHGGTVQLLEMPDVGHAFAGVKSAPQAVEWIAARFAGAPPPKSC